MPQDHAYALVGVVETDLDSPWELEAIHDFVVDFDLGVPRLSFNGPPRPLEPWASQTDLGFFVTSADWKRPSEDHRSNGFGGGGLVLRATRAPSPAGTAMHLALIALSLPHEHLPDAAMIKFGATGPWCADGAPGIGILHPIRRCPDDLKHVGNALSSIHKSPIWGWGAEKIGFASTMSLEAIDECTAVETLESASSDDPLSIQEIDRLKKEVAGAAMASSAKDRAYAEFRRRMIAELGPNRWDATPTRTVALLREQTAARIVRQMKLEDPTL